MKFLLTEEQRQLQDEVRRIAAAPGAHEALRAMVDGDASYDAERWRLLREFGAPAMIVPEEHGGLGLGLIELALIFEALGHAATPVPLFGHALATLAIAHGGDEAQRESWLPALASGETLATVALGEAGGAWEPSEWTVTGDGRLSGAKTNVPNGLDAGLAVVGTVGGGLAVVELASADVTRRAMDAIDRTRPLSTLNFDNAEAEPLANGVAATPVVRDAALALLAADAYGGASRCVEMAADYAKTREAFGATIAQFQAVKHQLANMVLEVEPCRGLYWNAALRCATGAAEAPHAAALAKAHAAEVFAKVSRHSIELHGGIGFTWEYDAHIWMKRAMFDYAWGGNSDVHFARAAALAGW